MALAPERTASRLASVAAKKVAHSPNSGATSATSVQALRGPAGPTARRGAAADGQDDGGHTQSGEVGS
jgi:hypothetical protein